MNMNTLRLNILVNFINISEERIFEKIHINNEYIYPANLSIRSILSFYLQIDQGSNPADFYLVC